MAQDDFLQFQERVKQAESRGRRYDDKGNLLTSPKGAQGEMQVMPRTQRDPGFGVTPAKGKSHDEIARVGRDYLAAMKQRYGDETLAAIAYNMGPGATDKWIAAGSDFSKLPAETQGYVKAVMGKTPSAPATASQPSNAPEIVEPALRSGMTAKAEDLGSGYKAALALSFLGEEDADKPVSDEDLQARLDREEDDAAAAELAAYKPKNALADLNLTATSHIKPVKLASGGLPFVPTLGITGTAREELDSIKAQYDKYNADIAAYNEALNKYKTELYDPYVAAVDKYNTAATAWNQGPRTTDFGMVAPTAPAEFTMAAPVAPGVSASDYEAKQLAAKQNAANRQLAVDVASDPERYGLTINKFFADGGDVETPMLFSVPTYAETVSHEMYPGQGGQFDQKDAARHMLAAGTLARKYGPGVAEVLGNLHEIKTSPGKWIGSKLGISEMPVDYEQDLHNNRVGIELAKRSKSQKDLEDLISAEAERAKSQRTPGAAWVGKPVKRADGSPETGEMGPYIGNPNIQRQGAAARALAAQRDVNTLPDPRTYAAVSGFLGTPVEQQGFSVLHPDLEGIKKAGDVGFMAGTAAQIAPAVGAMRNLGKGVTESAKALQGLKDIPVGASTKSVEPFFRHMPTPDAPFVGRLDEFVAGMQNPVRKDQFLGQLNGKFRDYEIERAQRALADLPENAKLQPVDLLNRLKERYDPSTMRTTILEPEMDKYWANQDNPYKGQPVGVVHLSTYASPEQMARIGKMNDLDTTLWRLGRVDETSQAAVPGTEVFRSDPIASTQLDRITAARQDLIDRTAPIREAKELMNDIRYPAISPRYDKLYKQFSEEARQAAGVYPDFATLNERVNSILIPQAEARLTQLFGEVPLSERALKEALTKKFGEDWMTEISKAEKNVEDMSRDFRRYVSGNPQIFGVEVPYKGKGIHSALNPPPNAASFTRFVEQQVQDPVHGQMKGIHLLEIQSDLTSELKAGRDVGLKKHEVFPNMPENRRVVQQLGMKNAIAAAINRGDQFVTFPGKESAKPQLYESVRDNLKQVAKDLGPGFEMRPFTFKNAEGTEMQHWGITWSPKAAVRTEVKGVPFKDGGSVERKTDDNRRYL